MTPGCKTEQMLDQKKQTAACLSSKRLNPSSLTLSLFASGSGVPLSRAYPSRSRLVAAESKLDWDIRPHWL
jgi:hypothetical protein